MHSYLAMRYFRFLLVWGALVVWSCGDSIKPDGFKTNTEKQIEVGFNANIHTSHIIELFVWPGEYPTRPMVLEAQEYFAPYKDHPAVTFSDSILRNEILYFDELTEVLLHYEPFPSTALRYPILGPNYQDKLELIQTWVDLLAQFYVDAKVGEFLHEHRVFYNGVRREVLKNLPPDNFVDLIESYYRAEKLKYTIIPAPEMPTGGAYGYRGIGPYLYTEEGMLIYQVISASLPVDKEDNIDNYLSYGFDNKENTLRMSYHEFGHAFVNPLFEKSDSLRAQLAQSEHLLTPGFLEVMNRQNYGDWETIVCEYLVRLGEIRLADRSGDTQWAKELRAYHTDTLQFIFLPELEQSILKYEADTSYQSFEAYLPQLLELLTQFDSTEVDRRLKMQ